MNATNRNLSSTGIDDALTLEAIYYSAQIPRNAAVLTILGSVFDRVYFPGVHIPKDGFDQKDLDNEIARIAALNTEDYDNSVLLALLRFVRHARTLDGFCIFAGESVAQVFTTSDQIPQRMVEDIYEAIHGPLPMNRQRQPVFSTAHHKMIPGSKEHVTYRDDYHYLAGALLESANTNIPLVNDVPGLPVPGVTQNRINDAKFLSAILAIECVRVVLPPLPVMAPEDLMEFRAENRESLRAFRRSMLRYASDLKSKIRDAKPEDLDEATKFFVQTEIIPALDELRATMEGPARPWYKRAIDFANVVPSLAVAFMTLDIRAALTKVLTTYARQFFTELTAKGDQHDSIKRSGFYYLLQLQDRQARH